MYKSHEVLWDIKRVAYPSSLDTVATWVCHPAKCHVALLGILVHRGKRYGYGLRIYRTRNNQVLMDIQTEKATLLYSNLDNLHIHGLYKAREAFDTARVLIEKGRLDEVIIRGYEMIVKVGAYSIHFEIKQTFGSVDIMFDDETNRSFPVISDDIKMRISWFGDDKTRMHMGVDLFEDNRKRAYDIDRDLIAIKKEEINKKLKKDVDGSRGMGYIVKNITRKMQEYVEENPSLFLSGVKERMRYISEILDSLWLVKIHGDTRFLSHFWKWLDERI